MEFGLEVHEDLYLLAGFVECVAEYGIACNDVVVVGSGGLHVAGSLHEGVDVEAGAGDGQEADGGEDAEAAAHIVGDDEAGVAFLVGGGTGGTATGIGDGDDDLAGLLLAALVLALLL